MQEKEFICPGFQANVWKANLCSECGKDRKAHKTLSMTRDDFGVSLSVMTKIKGEKPRSLRESKNHGPKLKDIKHMLGIFTPPAPRNTPPQKENQFVKKQVVEKMEKANAEESKDNSPTQENSSPQKFAALEPAQPKQPLVVPPFPRASNVSTRSEVPYIAVISEELTLKLLKVRMEDTPKFSPPGTPNETPRQRSSSAAELPDTERITPRKTSLPENSGKTLYRVPKQLDITSHFISPRQVEGDQVIRTKVPALPPKPVVHHLRKGHRRSHSNSVDVSENKREKRLTMPVYGDLVEKKIEGFGDTDMPFPGIPLHSDHKNLIAASGNTTTSSPTSEEDSSASTGKTRSLIQKRSRSPLSVNAEEKSSLTRSSPPVLRESSFEMPGEEFINSANVSELRNVMRQMICHFSSIQKEKQFYHDKYLEQHDINKELTTALENLRNKYVELYYSSGKFNGTPLSNVPQKDLLSESLHNSTADIVDLTPRNLEEEEPEFFHITPRSIEEDGHELQESGSEDVFLRRSQGAPDLPRSTSCEPLKRITVSADIQDAVLNKRDTLVKNSSHPNLPTDFSEFSVERRKVPQQQEEEDAWGYVLEDEEGQNTQNLVESLGGLGKIMKRGSKLLIKGNFSSLKTKNSPSNSPNGSSNNSSNNSPVVSSEKKSTILVRNSASGDKGALVRSFSVGNVTSLLPEASVPKKKPEERKMEEKKNVRKQKIRYITGTIVKKGESYHGDFLREIPDNWEQLLNQEVSEPTKAKVVAFKKYVEDLQWDLENYLEQRKERRKRIDEYLRVNGANISSTEKTSVLTKHLDSETTLLRQRRLRVGLKDFLIEKLIGKGAFGEVFLARKIKKPSFRSKNSSLSSQLETEKEVLALKKIKKSLLIERKQIDSILVEREVLKGTRSPWIVHLFHSFVDAEHLYLAMEYVPGGDLRALLDNILLTESQAKFYAAEMVMAVSTLHSWGFTHRDLKPDNFLIDKDGHLKLTDFGLSKGDIVRKKTSTTVRIYFEEDKVYRTLPIKSSTTADECIEMIFDRFKYDKSEKYNYVIVVRSGNKENPILGNELLVEIESQWKPGSDNKFVLKEIKSFKKLIGFGSKGDSVKTKKERPATVLFPLGDKEENAEEKKDKTTSERRDFSLLRSKRKNSQLSMRMTSGGSTREKYLSVVGRFQIYSFFSIQNFYTTFLKS